MWDLQSQILWCDVCKIHVELKYPLSAVFHIFLTFVAIIRAVCDKEIITKSYKIDVLVYRLYLDAH